LTPISFRLEVREKTLDKYSKAQLEISTNLPFCLLREWGESEVVPDV